MSVFENLSKSSEEFGPLMQQLVCFNKYKTIIEIGVAYGTTSLYLCNGCKNGGKVYGFDVWNTHGKWSQFPAISCKEDVSKYLKTNGVDNFVLYKQNTKENSFDKILDSIGIIDFAFIDGDHSYDGVKNDFDKIYHRMSSTGMIVFHDTLYIDGCREFIIDLRSKYNDGTYDIIEFPFGNLDRRVGLSILMKRIHLQNKFEIQEKCGSLSSFDQIYEKEQNWYKSQIK